MTRKYWGLSAYTLIGLGPLPLVGQLCKRIVDFVIKASTLQTMKLEPTE